MPSTDAHDFRPVPSDSTERKIEQIKRRLVREGTMAVSMLESALGALWNLDAEAARNVRRADDQVDVEEVAIESECYELLALHRPFAHDFRQITFTLRVNADLERVADHASSIAKVVQKIGDAAGQGQSVKWPTALTDLGQRVPAMCHQTLRVLMDEDEHGARALVQGDKVIDELEKRLFDEVRDMICLMGRDDRAITIGMFTYRAGRELERVGDLMASTAEDIVYLKTGQIIRHEKRRASPTGSTKHA
jgi:phosphate transport system protein